MTVQGAEGYRSGIKAAAELAEAYPGQGDITERVYRRVGALAKPTK